MSEQSRPASRLRSAAQTSTTAAAAMAIGRRLGRQALLLALLQVSAAPATTVVAPPATVVMCDVIVAGGSTASLAAAITAGAITTRDVPTAGHVLPADCVVSTHPLAYIYPPTRPLTRQSPICPLKAAIHLRGPCRCEGGCSPAPHACFNKQGKGGL